MQYVDGQILDTDQIKQLQKEGHNLDDKKLHVIRFLFNDKLNKASQPGPFKVKTEILDKLAKDAIGTPWLVLPDATKHPMGDNLKSDEYVKQLVDLTKEYGVGQIKSTIRYPSNNVWGIIEIFPKYEDRVHKDDLPALVSPLFNVLREDADGISDAQFLNLQSVEKSGYPAMLTRITSYCKNGLKECIQELSLAGAAGNNSSDSPESVSLTNNALGDSMSSQQNGNEITLPDLAKTVSDQGKALADLTKNVDAISTDVATIKTSLNGGKTEGNNPPANPKGAAGNDDPKNPGKQETMQIPADLKDNEWAKTVTEKMQAQEQLIKKMNDEREAEKAKAAEAKRKAAAESIAKMLVTHKKVEEKDKDATIKKYLEMKDEEGKPADLDTIEATLKSVIGTEAAEPTTKGATGPYSMFSRPDMTGDHSTQRSNAEILEEIS